MKHVKEKQLKCDKFLTHNHIIQNNVKISSIYNKVISENKKETFQTHFYEITSLHSKTNRKKEEYKL